MEQNLIPPQAGRHRDAELLRRPIRLLTVASTVALCVLLASCGHKDCDDATDASTLRNWINSQSGVYDFEFDKDRYVSERLELIHSSPAISSDTAWLNASVGLLRWWIYYKGPERFWSTIDTLYGVRRVLLSLEFGFTHDASYFARAIVATDDGLAMASGRAVSVPCPTTVFFRPISEDDLVTMLNELECRFGLFSVIPEPDSTSWGEELSIIQVEYVSKRNGFADNGVWYQGSHPADSVVGYLDSVFRAEVPDSSRSVIVGEDWR